MYDLNFRGFNQIISPILNIIISLSFSVERFLFPAINCSPGWDLARGEAGPSMGFELSNPGIDQK